MGEVIVEHPEGRWTHPLCLSCWCEMHPNRQPVRVRGAGVDMCCRCGMLTSAGIYVRADASKERWTVCPVRPREA